MESEKLNAQTPPRPIEFLLTLLRTYKDQRYTESLLGKISPQHHQLCWLGMHHSSSWSQQPHGQAAPSSVWGLPRHSPAMQKQGPGRHERWHIQTSPSSHSSLKSAAPSSEVLALCFVSGRRQLSESNTIAILSAESKLRCEHMTKLQSSFLRILLT